MDVPEQVFQAYAPVPRQRPDRQGAAYPGTKPADGFGKGFYTTGSYEQAEKWAKDVRRRRKADHAYVSEYEYKESGRLKILVFDGPTDEWLDFVEMNRIRGDGHDYDIVIGPVADEGVFYILALYETGVLSREETISKLGSARLDGQVLSHTDLSAPFVRCPWTIPQMTDPDSSGTAASLSCSSTSPITTAA